MSRRFSWRTSPLYDDSTVSEIVVMRPKFALGRAPVKMGVVTAWPSNGPPPLAWYVTVPDGVGRFASMKRGRFRPALPT